jgi:hypothetical protein
MTQQIFSRGNINTSRYSNDEKRRVTVKILNRMKNSLNKYKANKAAGKNEKTYGMYRNQAHAFMRGYRALNPLSGKVKSPRIRNATPNRWTPASPTKVNRNFVSLENLKKPHLVVKRRGTETFYVNPNTLASFIKSSSGANIAEENLRNWLREARRNRPSEKLFQHPANKAKYIRPKNIRFSRA